MSALQKLKELAEMVKNLDLDDLQRFRQRAERIEKLLEEIRDTLKRIESCLCRR